MSRPLREIRRVAVRRMRDFHAAFKSSLTVLVLVQHLAITSIHAGRQAQDRLAGRPKPGRARRREEGKERTQRASEWTETRPSVTEHLVRLRPPSGSDPPPHRLLLFHFLRPSRAASTQERTCVGGVKVVERGQAKQEGEGGKKVECKFPRS